MARCQFLANKERKPKVPTSTQQWKWRGDRRWAFFCLAEQHSDINALLFIAPHGSSGDKIFGAVGEQRVKPKFLNLPYTSLSNWYASRLRRERTTWCLLCLLHSLTTAFDVLGWFCKSTRTARASLTSWVRVDVKMCMSRAHFLESQSFRANGPVSFQWGICEPVVSQSEAVKEIYLFEELSMSVERQW